MSKPVEIAAGRVWLTYWPETGRIQIAKVGKTARGRIKAVSVTLDREELSAEAVDLLAWFVGKAEGEPK